MEQECIPVGCVPTVAVAATRCLYWGGGIGQTPWRQTPLLEADPCFVLEIALICRCSHCNHFICEHSQPRDNTVWKNDKNALVLLELLPGTSSSSGLVVNSMPWAQGCMNTGSLAHGYLI